MHYFHYEFTLNCLASLAIASLYQQKTAIISKDLWPNEMRSKKFDPLMYQKVNVWPFGCSDILD
jgi:hypothetical protein